MIAFGVLAEGVTRLGIVDEAYLPYASTVLRRSFELLGSSEFLSDVGWTLLGWSLSLVIATAVGVLLGAALATSRVTAAVAGVAVNALRPVPAVALVPLASLVLGQGLGMKLALVSFSALWPVLFNTVTGVRDTDPVALDTARSFGLSRRAAFARIALPSAAPHVFTGVRVAASVAMVVIVGIEVIAGASNGIGAFILNASSSGTDMPSVMAGALIAGVIGLVINVGFAKLDHLFLGWSRREVAK